MLTAMDDSVSFIRAMPSAKVTVPAFVSSVFEARASLWDLSKFRTIRSSSMTALKRKGLSGSLLDSSQQPDPSTVPVSHFDDGGGGSQDSYDVLNGVLIHPQSPQCPFDRLMGQMPF